jgi:hypothetical protein
VAFLRSLYHDDRADHLGGRSYVEVQRFAVLWDVRIGMWASVALSLSSAS